MIDPEWTLSAIFHALVREPISKGIHREGRICPEIPGVGAEDKERWNGRWENARQQPSRIERHYYLQDF